MKLVEKLIARSQDNRYQPPVTLAFIGDSVTQGCFEVTHIKKEGAYPIKDVHDQDAVYHQVLRQMLADLYPSVPINVINAGVSGGHAYMGVDRLERDVISHRPDLAVVCFGLNDSGAGLDGLEKYAAALRGILARLRKEGIDAVLLTPNMMCRRVDCRITDELERRIAAGIVPVQNDGVLDAYMDAARAAAAAEGARLCDCYALWKAMDAAGMDTTAMLSNHINHPSRELHWLFAWKLFETIFEG